MAKNGQKSTFSEIWTSTHELKDPSELKQILTTKVAIFDPGGLKIVDLYTSHGHLVHYDIGQYIGRIGQKW